MVRSLLVLCVLLGIASVARGGLRVTHHRYTREVNTDKKELVQADRELFILAHNEARSVAEPTASNMPFMVSALIIVYVTGWGEGGAVSVVQW